MEQKERIALACCSVALGSLIPVALFQLNILKRLPDPPGAIFDSRTIVMSKDAFPFGIPDGLLGLASYGTTFLLIFAAGQPAGSRNYLLTTSLQGKLLLDGSMAAWNATKQVTQFGRICSWCMGTALATGAMFYFRYGTVHPSRRKA